MIEIKSAVALWNIEARFPSHCGTPSYTRESYYGAASLDSAIAAHRSQYSHATITKVHNIGSVFAVGELPEALSAAPERPKEAK